LSLLHCKRSLTVRVWTVRVVRRVNRPRDMYSSAVSNEEASLGMQRHSVDKEWKANRAPRRYGVAAMPKQQAQKYRCAIKNAALILIQPTQCNIYSIMFNICIYVFVLRIKVPAYQFCVIIHFWFLFIFRHIFVGFFYSPYLCSLSLHPRFSLPLSSAIFFNLASLTILQTFRSSA